MLFRVRPWKAFGVVIVCAAVVEWLQPFVARTGELSDWLYGSAGAGLILLFQHGRCGTLRWAVLLAGSVLVAWGPVLGEHWVIIVPERNAWPLLADDGGYWSIYGPWEMEGVCKSFAGQRFIPAKDVPYPGIFRTPRIKDWRSAGEIEIVLDWGAPGPAELWFRLDDGRTSQPTFDERFQTFRHVVPGRNVLRIPKNEFSCTPGGTFLDLAHIQRWGLFLVSPVTFHYIDLKTVRILPNQESTAS